MSASPRPGRLGIAAVLAGLVSCLVPSAVSAGTDLFFIVQPFYECFEVTGPVDETIDVVLRTSQGEVVAATEASTDAAGEGSGCFGEPARVMPTDRLIGRWGGTNSHTYVVPNFTIAIDRVADRVTGKAPPNSTVNVRLETNNTISPLAPVIIVATTGPSGSYSADFTSNRNMRGGDTVIARHTDGDSVIHEVVVPYMQVAVKGNRFEAFAVPWKSAAFQLRTSGGALRATASGRADEEGELEGLFWRSANGALVASAFGDKVTGTFASDAALTIPNLSIVPNASTDVVSGVCLSDRRYWITINGFSGFRIGNAAANGAYSEDYSTGATVDIQPGDLIEVTCMFGTGDQIVRRKLAS